MNSKQRCLAALNWQKPDRVPVIPQNSDMAIFISGYDMIECSRNPRKLANALLESHEKFGYDGILLGPDAAILAEALGCEAKYRKDDPPAIINHLLNNLEDVDDLKMIDISKNRRVKVWLEATKIILDKVGNNTFVICRADQGAFSLATILSGVQEMMLNLAMEEDIARIRKLLDFCNNIHIDFAKAIKNTGVHMTTCGDAYGGPELISPKLFDKYVLPYEIEASRQIISKIQIPYSIHICGKTDLIQDLWIKSAPTVFEVDHRTNISTLRKLTLNKTAILGNLDTERLCNASTIEIENSCKELFKVMLPESGFILSSGCSMGGNTKQENLETMVESAKCYGTYS